MTALKLDRADVVPGDVGEIGPPGAPEWADAPATGVFSLHFDPPRLDYMTLSIAPDPDAPGRWRVWVFGLDV